MRYRTRALVFLALSVILLVTALVMGVRALAPAAGGESAPPASSETSGSSGFFGLFSRATPTPEPTAIPTETPEPTATPWPGPDIPAQAVPAGQEYFADAAFLGNSILSGLWIYDHEDLFPDDKGQWFMDDGLTVLGAMPYAEQMADGNYGKIYVGFGNNEMSYDRTAVREAYNMLIDKLQADHPDAVIYLVSATPVSRWKSSNSSSFTRELVQSYNEMVKAIAEERQVWYLNAYSVLCDEEGYLPADVTNDGTHFTPAHYDLWFEYMKTHYIPTGSMPVPENSPIPMPPAATDPSEDAGA